MVFSAPSWVPPMPQVPDTSIFEFMFDEKYGRASFDTSLPPYICGISGTVVSARELKTRVESLARGLASELGWKVNEGSSLDKVVGIFALNTIDIPTLTWAVHRLNGVCAPVNSAFTAAELAHHLSAAGAKVIITVLPLVQVAQEAAKQIGIPEHRIYICDMPGPNGLDGLGDHARFTTIGDLLKKGTTMPDIESLQWSPGRSKQQVAFLSHSSGTSGPPKIAMITHANIIANVIQMTLFEQKGRGGPSIREKVLGILPHSHIYGVVMISHLSTFRGDSIIVLPKFDMAMLLESVTRYKIKALNLVPPIIVAMSKNIGLLQQYDLSSVRTVVSGGAPLSQETIARFDAAYPHWIFRQAYGLTEVAACACHTSAHDPWQGSSGSVVTGCEVKLVAKDGKEIVAQNTAGEIWVKSPSNILGYLGDHAATKETFHEDGDERWLKTGDIGLFKQSSGNTEHIFIVDRVKELIKVKGFQVVPAELENVLLTHPSVADCAVIGVPDSHRGEAPRAYVQRSKGTMAEPEDTLAEELDLFIKGRLARYKWLRGGIIFVDSIPKSPSGKILRRILRKQAAAEGVATAKL